MHRELTHYDRRYFDKWYRHPRHRVKSRRDMHRQLGFIVAATEYLLDRPVRSVLDVVAEVTRIVRELKALGHDLWSFDQSDDFAIGTYDYQDPPPGSRLTIHFGWPTYEEPAVEVTVQAAP